MQLVRQLRTLLKFNHLIDFEGTGALEGVSALVELSGLVLQHRKFKPVSMAALRLLWNWTRVLRGLSESVLCISSSSSLFQRVKKKEPWSSSQMMGAHQ